MIDCWSSWYSDLDPERPQPYGDSDAYRLGAEWLADCPLVEDWGCGMGWFRQFVPPDRYWGLDGTDSPFCDRHVDLVDYRSQVPGIFMRGVLEHNTRWKTVLRNAAASFTQRFALVIFTPPVDRTRIIARNVGGLGVPDIAFRTDDLVERIPGTVTVTTIASETMYGAETVICAQR